MSARISPASQAIVHKTQPQLYAKGKWGAYQTKDLSVYEETAHQIVENQVEILKNRAPAEIYNYIRTFNSAWTTECLAQNLISGPSKKDSSSVQFSSVDKKNAWLSNFFQTLIYDEGRSRILPHVEAGYVAFKAESSEEGNAYSETIVTVMDPKKVKSMGAQWERPDEERSVSEMTRLSRLKYNQNPILQQLLRSTGERPLEEHTSDFFWGTAHGCGGENKLGHILEQVRAAIT